VRPEVGASPWRQLPWYAVSAAFLFILMATLVGTLVFISLNLSVCFLIDAGACQREDGLAFIVTAVIATLEYAALELVLCSICVALVVSRFGRIRLWQVILLVPALIVAVGLPARALPGLMGKTISPLSWLALRDPFSLGITVLVCLLVSIQSCYFVNRFHSVRR
jgi:hypothetical protein